MMAQVQVYGMDGSACALMASSWRASRDKAKRRSACVGAGKSLHSFLIQTSVSTDRRMKAEGHRDHFLELIQRSKGSIFLTSFLTFHL